MSRRYCGLEQFKRMQDTLQPLRVLTLAWSLVLASCGGGNGTSQSACATNATATIDGSIAEVREAFGGTTFSGTVCRPHCIYGGSITIQSDGAGGDWGGVYRFAIASVCKNGNVPDTLYVSGTWSDGSAFTNARFLWQQRKIRNLTLPTGGYFDMS